MFPLQGGMSRSDKGVQSVPQGHLHRPQGDFTRRQADFTAYGYFTRPMAEYHRSRCIPQRLRSLFLRMGLFPFRFPLELLFQRLLALLLQHHILHLHQP